MYFLPKHIFPKIAWTHPTCSDKADLQHYHNAHNKHIRIIPSVTTSTLLVTLGSPPTAQKNTQDTIKHQQDKPASNSRQYNSHIFRTNSHTKWQKIPSYAE